MNRTTRLALPALLTACVLAVPAGCASNGKKEPQPDLTENPAAAAALAKAEAYRKGSSLAEEAQRLEKDGHIDRAIELYTQAVQTYRNLPGAWHNLGLLLYQRERRQEAASAFQIAAELLPGDPRPPYNLGVIWEKNGYADDAARFYDDALLRDENYLPALRGAIKLDQYRNKATETTAKRLRQALMLDQDPVWREFYQRQQIRLREQDKALMESLAH